MKENSTTGRRYDREFKQNAVEWVRAGRTVSRVARDLGVSTWSLGRWVQAANGGQAQSEPKTLAAESDEQRELRRLRQEVDYLREQRDILKKSAQASCQRRGQGALPAEGSDAKGPLPARVGAGPGGVGQRFSRPPAEGPRPAPPGRSGVEPCHRAGLYGESADRRPPALSRRRCAKRANGAARTGWPGSCASTRCTQGKSVGGGPKPPRATMLTPSPRTGWRRCPHPSGPIRCG